MADDDHDPDTLRRQAGGRVDADRESAGNYPWRRGERDRLLAEMLLRERRERDTRSDRRIAAQTIRNGVVTGIVIAAAINIPWTRFLPASRG